MRQARSATLDNELQDASRANKKAKVTLAAPVNKSNPADVAAAIATLTAPSAKPAAAGGRRNTAGTAAAVTASADEAAAGGGRGKEGGRGDRGGRGA